MISSFKAVFFDAGGTLFYPYPSVGEIYSRVALGYGCPATSDELEHLFKKAWFKRDGLAALVSHSSEKIEKEWWRGLVEEVFSQVGGVRNFGAFFEELYEVFGRPHVWRLYPETQEVLEELKRRGKRLAIVSNWDSRLFNLCEGLSLKKYFDLILASAVFGAAKPNPSIFQEALRQLHVAPHEAVHIGDSFEDDIQGARLTGIEAILIDRSTQRKFQNQNIKTISELRVLIQ